MTEASPVAGPSAEYALRLDWRRLRRGGCAAATLAYAAATLAYAAANFGLRG
jgi:hypothetical protein